MLDSSSLPTIAPTGLNRDFVVIGSGLAGYGVVRELRKVAPDATIAVITRDAGHFYSKPALSTALAKGKAPEQLVTMAAERMVSSHRLDLVSEADVVEIDRASRRVRLSDRDIAYDALILATGASAIPLPCPIDPAAPMASINSLDDYARFRSFLRPGLPVAIVGAGLVGCELANDLVLAGHPVTVIDAMDQPLGRLLPAPVGALLRDRLAEAGVAWQLGMTVARVDAGSGGAVVILASGVAIPAGVVVSAIGLKPQTALAEAAGLQTDRGIVVDAAGRTSDPAIFALGDCAQYPHGLSAYVTPIMAAARTIAENAAGGQATFAFPPLSVQVKSTVYPIVLLPVPPGAAGRWVCEEDNEEGSVHAFVNADANWLGYVATGSACPRRGEFDARVQGREHADAG